jgi:SAM-dependent methyltransferase
MPTLKDLDAGQAVYTPIVLRTYDWVVLGLSNRLLWRCPTADLRRLYDRNVSARHLDIGVGTGYFLDKATWPVPIPSITLLDLNANCLRAASKRISRYAPHTVLANILAPLPPLEPFTSVGLCYLLHCVPGAIPEKAVAFDRLRSVLAPGARVFGATIVQGEVPRSRAAQALMSVYNRKGIFSNAADTVEDLDVELRKRFTNVKLQVKGTVALFEAVSE